MVDDSSDSTPPTASTRPPAARYQPGDRIRIATGKLSGLTGRIVSLRDHNNCVLTIDAWTDGVYVIVSSQSLERI
jgi:ribosomal protein L24